MRVTRRTFLKATGATGVAVAAANRLLSDPGETLALAGSTTAIVEDLGPGWVRGPARRPLRRPDERSRPA
jgi:hypothetical protein